MPFSALAGGHAGSISNNSYALPQAFVQPRLQPFLTQLAPHGGNTSRHYRYRKIQPAQDEKFHGFPQRKKRDTIPLWTSAVSATLPPAATQAPQPHATPAAPAFIPIPRRALILLAHAYSELFSCSFPTAQARLQQADASLYEAWRDIDCIEQIDWQPGAQSYSAYGLAYATSEFTSRLVATPGLFDSESLPMAKFYLGQNAVFSPNEDDRYGVYQGVLQRGLNWIDLDKVRERLPSPAEILQAVYHHRRPEIDSRDALLRLLQRSRGVLIDEAALIFFHTQTQRHDEEQNTRIDTMRKQYADALAREWLDASLRLRLLPSSPIALTHAPFWFDGKSIRNSIGKHIEQMVSEIFSSRPGLPEAGALEKIKHNASRSRHLLGQPEYPITRESWLSLLQSLGCSALQRKPYPMRDGAIEIDGWHVSRDELYALFEKAMHDVGLDANYPAGTPHYEMASLLRQLGHAHDVAYDNLNNPAELIAAFNRLQAAWLDQPRSPISPTLLAAINLARRNNVFLYRTTSPRTRDQQAADQTLPAMIAALKEAGVDIDGDLAHAHSLLDQPGQGRDETFRRLASVATRMSLYVHLMHETKALQEAPEVISYANTTELVDRLHVYFHEHLRAFATAPAFDKFATVTRILRDKLGLTDDQLNMPRMVLLGTVSLSNPPRSLLPISEFFARSQMVSSVMSHNGTAIAPAKVWRLAQHNAVKMLARHPVIVAKSKGLLRLRKAPYTSDDIALLAETQASNIVNQLPEEEPNSPNAFTLGDLQALLDRLFGSPTLTAVVEAFSSGDARQIAGLFPFVLPLFDIEEGIRKGDWRRALDGAIHFGEDALFTLAGAGLEAAMARGMASGMDAMRLARTAMPMTERIGIDSLRGLGEIMPEFSGRRLGERPTSINRDAFDIHADTAMPAQTLPKTLPDASTPDGAAPHIHYLIVEGKTVMAIPAGSGFAEIDSRGTPLPAAPPILAHPHSGEHYRLTRKFGLPHGAAGITDLELSRRTTVAGIADYWRTIDIRQARIAKPRPLDIIRDLIESNTHPRHEQFEQLLLDVYTRSETGRAIINHAHAQSPYNRRRCSISYDENDARAYAQRITFMSDEKLSQFAYIGPAGAVRFQEKRMMIHEVLHFLTGLKDAPIHEEHNQRGSNVGLVEKVLSETLGSAPYPPRLAYARNGNFRVRQHRDGTFHTNSRILRQLNEMSIAEDRYLDNIFDAEREFPASMYVAGQPIAERATVRQGLELLRHLLRNTGKLGEGNTRRIAAMLLDALKLPSTAHRTMLKALTVHSRTFRILAVTWEAIPRAAPVKIQLIPARTIFSKYTKRHRVPHTISLARDRIWLNANPLYYFSSLDLTPLSETRRFLNALLDLFIKTILPDIDDIALKDFSDRGIRGVLENEIMRQSSVARPATAEPPRICAALTPDPNAYLADQSALTRAAISEDGYLYNQAKLLAASQDEGEARPQPCPAAPGRQGSLFSCLDL